MTEDSGCEGMVFVDLIVRLTTTVYYTAKMPGFSQATDLGAWKSLTEHHDKLGMRAPT